jgi:hypothetical protein
LLFAERRFNHRGSAIARVEDRCAWTPSLIVGEPCPRRRLIVSTSIPEAMRCEA